MPSVCPLSRLQQAAVYLPMKLVPRQTFEIEGHTLHPSELERASLSPPGTPARFLPSPTSDHLVSSKPFLSALLNLSRENKSVKAEGRNREAEVYSCCRELRWVGGRKETAGRGGSFQNHRGDSADACLAAASITVCICRARRPWWPRSLMTSQALQRGHAHIH